MRALDAVPDGRSDTVVATTAVPAIPPGLLGVSQAVDMISNRIYAVVSTMRAVHDAVDDADPTTADLLHAIIDGLEKEAWLLKSENGTA
nr:hypothetical protein MFLOJ_20820 [Mycobacterium florentinum]